MAAKTKVNHCGRREKGFALTIFTWEIRASDAEFLSNVSEFQNPKA
jgi:hypothetical protein